MLYEFLFSFAKYSTFFNVFKYITFRTIYAALTALLISLILGPWLIKKLQKMQIGQVVRDSGPESHKEKTGTPTMGGVLIIVALVVPTLLWADIRSRYVWIALGVTVSFGIIGFIDDYLKIREQNSKGLSGWSKFAMQMLFATIFGVLIVTSQSFSTHLSIPFFKNISPDIGYLYIPFAVFLIVGASNGVNLTDGLDGLAIGPILIAFSTYLLLSYVSGNARIAHYLAIPFASGAGELTVFCGAMVGAGMGFLWYNTYPAQIFMGDVGSLSLGAAFATVGILTKQDMLLAIVGGIFVVETLSVILQVGSFKLRGKRIFRMAPIHHHFELKGWAEPKVIVRFWIISIVLALISISTLKLR